MESKKCSKCGVEKPLTSFWKNRIRKDGLEFWCIGCTKQCRYENKEKIAKKAKRYYQENKSKKKESSKKYREENSERLAIERKKYYQENRDKILERQRERRRGNIESHRKRARIYYKKNRDKLLKVNVDSYWRRREKILESNKERYQNNADEIKRKARNYTKENREDIAKRRKINTDSCSDSYMINQLCRKGFKTEDITPELIEYKRQDLKLYRLINDKKL